MREVSFYLQAGEQLGLIGENGAGKSTLIKLLSGVHRPDSGEMLWQGRPAAFQNPLQAMQAGIATIHQELFYFEKLTVAENLLMGDPWPRRSWGAVAWPELYAEAARRLEVCGLNLDPATPFHRLSTAQRQELAIARSLAKDSKLLILDEPTASLTQPEVARLGKHLERLRARGVAMIYVSHRLEEILQFTERVCVLRDGVLVTQYRTRETDIPAMVRAMVGRELIRSEHKVTRTVSDSKAELLLEVRDLACEPYFREISFTVAPGEILGLGGLVGAGRSKLARAIFGMHRPTSGTMTLAGEKYCPGHPAEAIDRGVVYIPEERKRQGFVLQHSIASAISIGFRKKISSLGWIHRQRESGTVANLVSIFGIRIRSVRQPVGTLSGGNQQKALLARSLQTPPRLAILDEPTRGVDVGAKAEIQKFIQQLAARGTAILLISSDLPELIAVSSRILVLHHGRVTSCFDSASATQEQVLLAASGLKKDSF